jgi:anti-sigma factor (TIGR02949 family)
LSGCGDNIFRIGLLVRGELDRDEEATLRAHLAACAACTADLAAEEQLSRDLQKLATLTAPADLRAQVQEKMRAQRGAGRQFRAAPWVGAAAVIALAIVGATLAVRSRPTGDALTVAAQQAAAERDSLDRQRDLFPSETANAPVLLRELAQRYRLPTTTAFPGDEDLRLVSVRPATALGKVAAVLVYLDKENRLVTLEIAPGNDVQIPPKRTRPIQQFRPVVERVQQCGVVVWKQGGALYVLAAQVADEDLARLFVKVRTGTS